jgi:putative hemolysin
MDTASIVLHLVGLTLLMVCSSFFSGSETALTALTKLQVHRIRGDKKKSSRAIILFLDEPRRLFITVLFGNTLVNMAFVSITGSLIFNNLFRGEHPGFAYVVAILTETFLLLIFGEITPKTFAINHSERIAQLVSRPLWFFSGVIYPFRRPLRLLTDMLLPLFGVRSGVEERPLTEEEIRAIVKTTEDMGALHTDEGRIIYNIFELHDIQAKEAMIPRTEMVCIDVSKTIQDAFDLTRETGRSRLPVYREKLDNICGIFYVKDMPRWKGMKSERLGGRSIEQLTIEEFLSSTEILKELNPGSYSTLVRPPLFVIQTKKIGPLIRQMTKEKQQMAILLDEYGGVSGLITGEDIVEEVLGEIFDEYDKLSEWTISKDPKDPDGFLIPGFVSLRTANRHMRLKIGMSGADTVGGYVTQLIGAIPEEGEVVTDRLNGLVFEVVKRAGNRISLVKMKKMGKAAKKDYEKQGTYGAHFFSISIISLISVIAFDGPGVTGHGVIQQSRLSLYIFSLLLVLSLFLKAFFAGAETAVVSASKGRIDALVHQGKRRALHIKKLWQEPDKLLGTVLVGDNLMSTAAGVASLQLIVYALPAKKGLHELLNTIVMTFLLMVFCEILPKTTFRAKADILALKSAPALWISARIMRPGVLLATKITNLMVRMGGRQDIEETQKRRREELKLAARMGEKEGILGREELRMIQSVLDLDTMTLEKIMTPLVDVTALPKAASVGEFFRVAAETGYSRIPVYEDRVDNMIGIVNVLDVLYSKVPSPTIAPYMRRDIRHEPESKRVYSLLRELKRSRKTMVFVVDEYGGVVGLVTIEDLIEEILGDIRDEKDRDDEGDVRRISDKIIECEGKAEIQFLNNFYGMEIPSGDYNTIAGYIISLLERIPRSGEIVETNELKIVILDADVKSIRKVRIQNKD